MRLSGGDASLDARIGFWLMVTGSGRSGIQKVPALVDADQ